jgi:ribosomal protein L32
MSVQTSEVDARTYGYFFGLVISTVIIVTIIYWAIFGFDRWSGNMQRASDLMTAATGTPVAQANTLPPGAGQYVCPRSGVAGCPVFSAAGIPRCPGCGQAMRFHRAFSGNPTLAATGTPVPQANTLPSGAGQYVCPRYGALGCPVFDAAGIPRCPGCGQAMRFHRAP